MACSQIESIGHNADVVQRRWQVSCLLMPNLTDWGSSAAQGHLFLSWHGHCWQWNNTTNYVNADFFFWGRIHHQQCSPRRCPGIHLWETKQCCNHVVWRSRDLRCLPTRWGSASAMRSCRHCVDQWTIHFKLVRRELQQSKEQSSTYARCNLHMVRCRET